MAIHTAICDGMDGMVVTIESQFVRGFSGLHMIGNISESLRDSKERARTALEVLGIHVPAKKLIMSITPADIKKVGHQFDLALAVSLMLLLDENSNSYQETSRFVFVAELSLTGELKPVKGVISYAIAALAEGFDGLVVASKNLGDLAILKGFFSDHKRFADLQIHGFDHLTAVRNWLIGVGEAVSFCSTKNTTPTPPPLNFNDMILDAEMYRIALCLAVGRHSLIMQGPPGTGKSMFASRLPSIMPPLEDQEHLQVLKIGSSHTVNIDARLLAGCPPFRSPHHTASAQGIIGTAEQPGDLALAHGGVLFLDEFPEFRRDIIEALREPLETGEVHISRAKSKISWNARLLLVAAANNCPCGYWGSRKKKCTCPISRVLSYRRKLSGPIIDRIDLHINIPENKNDASMLFDLFDDRRADQTTAMQARVTECSEFSKKRNIPLGLRFNNTIPAKQLLAVSGLSMTAFKKLLEQKFLQSLNKRSLLKTLRVARTIADLDLEPKLALEHVEQAYCWQAEAAAQARGDFALGLT